MRNKRAMMLGLDGADPVVVKRLMEAGRLPSFKKIVDIGSNNDTLSMLGAFPTVTPPNWASLATGNWPRTHGICDFMNHTLGKSLGITEMNWDSRRIESELIWEAFEDENKRCIMLNYCEAWPNRVEGSKNIFVDGTSIIPFLQTAVDFQKLVTFEEGVFQTKIDPHFLEPGAALADGAEAFVKPTTQISAMAKGCIYGSMPLEAPASVIMPDFSPEHASQGDYIDRIYTSVKEPIGWAIDLPDDAKAIDFPVNKGLTRRFAIASKSDEKVYDTISVYGNKKSAPLGQAKIGAWSDWIYDTYLVDERPLKVAYKIRVLDITEDGTKGRFYLSHVCNLEDFSFYYPQGVGKELLDNVGPMLYYATFDRYTALGDEIMLESFAEIYEWHAKAVDYLFANYPDWALFYTHIHGIDMSNHWYINESVEGSHPRWREHAEVINRMYEINDRFVGSMLKYLDDDTMVFICSDHAAVPRTPGCVNPGIGELSGINGKVLSDLGYTTVFDVPGYEGLHMVDWSTTRAVQHRSNHVYINLKGRDPEGIVAPEDYDQLVQDIISDLYSYRDPIKGDRVVAFCMTREEMECVGMGGEHSGDIFFQLHKDYGFEHAHAPSYCENYGYSLACLCMMAGGGLKTGATFKRPIRIVDVVPTICHVCGVRQPKGVEGGVIYQALEEK